MKKFRFNLKLETFREGSGPDSDYDDSDDYRFDNFMIKFIPTRKYQIPAAGGLSCTTKHSSFDGVQHKEMNLNKNSQILMIKFFISQS